MKKTLSSIFAGVALSAAAQAQAHTPPENNAAPAYETLYSLELKDLQQTVNNQISLYNTSQVIIIDPDAVAVNLIMGNSLESMLKQNYFPDANSFSDFILIRELTETSEDNAPAAGQINDVCFVVPYAYSSLSARLLPGLSLQEEKDFANFHELAHCEHDLHANYAMAFIDHSDGKLNGAAASLYASIMTETYADIRATSALIDKGSDPDTILPDIINQRLAYATDGFKYLTHTGLAAFHEKVNEMGVENFRALNPEEKIELAWDIVKNTLPDVEFVKAASLYKTLYNSTEGLELVEKLNPGQSKALLELSELEKQAQSVAVKPQNVEVNYDAESKFIKQIKKTSLFNRRNPETQAKAFVNLMNKHYKQLEQADDKEEAIKETRKIDALRTTVHKNFTPGF